MITAYEANDTNSIHQALQNYDAEDVEDFLANFEKVKPSPQTPRPPIPVTPTQTRNIGYGSIEGRFNTPNNPFPDPGASTVGSTIDFSTTQGQGQTQTAASSVPMINVPRQRQIEISESELRSLWSDIEGMDVTILSPDVVKAFEYQGFNPEAVLRTMAKHKKANNINDRNFLLDVMTLCSIAIIKGSITKENLTKMSDAGKMRYDELEKRYGITRGGGKAKPAEVVTVARIAAAFPGIVIRLLQENKVPGRKFVADLGTHNLPSAMRHQAFAAVIPHDLDDDCKKFLLDLTVCFSVDQTKVISKTKDSLLSMIDRQKQFTDVSHNSVFPSDSNRKQIFKKFNWKKMYPDMLSVATKIKTKWPEIIIVDESHLLSAISRI